MAKKIRFHYLYRDSGNYKKFGHKDFSNPTNLYLNDINVELQKVLIDGMFFYPEKVGIRKFLFHRYLDDFSWYEMECIEFVSSGSCKETILDFIDKLRKGEGNLTY